MKRKFSIILAALAILWSGNVFAALEALEEAAELTVSKVQLPAGGAGNVVYRGCAGCEPMIWPVDSATTYHIGVGSEAVSLVDLRQAASGNRDGLIYVFYAPDSGTVTRIVLSELRVTDE